MKLMRTIGFLLALFGAAGFATSVQAARESDPNAKDLVLKGDAKCTGCHDEADEPSPSMIDLHPSVLSIAKTKHGMKGDSRTPTCTNCHGESLDHIGYKGKEKPPKPDRVFTKHGQSSAEVRNEACTSCHRGGSHMNWKGSAHEMNDVACTNCHSVHVAKDKVLVKSQQQEVCYQCHKQQRSESMKISSHPLRDGKITCSSCHKPHGSTGPKLLAKGTLNETCYTCHAEKRGPFLWEHAPVREDCAICHTPHGSNTTPLLKQRTNFLCQSCHSAEHSFYSGYSLPGQGGDASRMLGKQCLNCHQTVHGSNHPSGVRKFR